MNWFKLIFAVALSVILVVSTLTALFGAARVVNAALRTYVFKVEECRYEYARPFVAENEEVKVPEEEECSINYNSAKRDIADGIGMFVIAAPLAWFMYGQTRKMIGESKK